MPSPRRPRLLGGAAKWFVWLVVATALPSLWRGVIVWAQTDPVTSSPILISEIHIAPQAVDDRAGEWLELVNRSEQPVDLQQWVLMDDDGDRHVQALSLVIPPGGYVVLAANGDPASNGGVMPATVYQTLRFANDNGRLQLYTPDGALADEVAWGGDTALTVYRGASLERVAAQPGAAWVVAHSPWPGSAGDRGSPGQPYTAPPTVTPTPSETPTAPPTPTATPPPTLTPPPAHPPRLLISEIMIDPAAVPDETGEWIELVNGHHEAVNLRDWVLADDDRDWTVLAADYWLQPGAYALLARSADATANGGITPHLLYTGLQLANDGDELRLIAPWGVEADRVVWGGEVGPRAPTGASLERVGFAAPPRWVVAHSLWPGSAGDRGSPGQPYVPPPTATPTETPVSTPTVMPTTIPVSTPMPTPTELPTATSTPPPDNPPRLLISEIMIDPAAVPDETGEWIELFNGHHEAVNLRDWVLADDDRDWAVLASEYWLAPSAYALLARSADPAVNGGVTPHLLYERLQLANNGDELRLIAPWGVEADRVVWGGDVGPRAPTGASLERAGFAAPPRWVVAHAVWSGSAGDRGSPGQPYVPPPEPTLTATLAPPTPTATPLAGTWPRAPLPSALQIDQVFAPGSDAEYIVLVNTGSSPMALDGWTVGDAEVPGDAEGLVALPAGVSLAPGTRYVLARNAVVFRDAWGVAPNAEWSESDPSVPTLPRVPGLASRDIALADQGDEVILLDPTGALADAMAFANGEYAVLGLHGWLPAASSRAYWRAPGAAWPAVTDVRHRFLLAPPNPAIGYTLPVAQPRPPVMLDQGMAAVWGSLGAVSAFSASGVAPPHVVAAAAATQGLDFIAIADEDRAPTDFLAGAQPPDLILVPAWRWQNLVGDRAVVYAATTAVPWTFGELFDFLEQHNGLAQLPATGLPAGPRTPLLAADGVSAPGGLHSLTAAWRAAGRPLLPAGNTTPLHSGGALPAPRYTGLAVTRADHAGIHAALAAGRGWLTSSPDLWVTLRTVDGVWMGGTVAPANELVVEIAAGHRSSPPIAVTLWQDDRIVRQLELSAAQGRSQVTVPMPPATFLYVVATLTNGDFAVSAPLYSTATAGGRVVLNEALPRAAADHNGDGQINTDDEFIELYNPGNAPIFLAGWQIMDASERRFTLGPERFLGAGGFLTLWRVDSNLSLNDDSDRLVLLDPSGEVVDEMSWGQRRGGDAPGRYPDGDAWRDPLQPTPGQPNRPFPPSPPPTESPKPDPLDVHDPTGPNFGQATGPPGSLAVAKLRGLYAPVEFRGQVTVPPGLFNSVIYVAEAAPPDAASPALAGLGVQVYLAADDFIPMQEGDWLLVRGTIRTFRGEMEIHISEPGQAWRIGPGTPLLPLPVTVAAVGEALEGRLVTLEGVVTGWQGDSIYLGDPDTPDAPSLRVTVRSSLDWKRPFVQRGERYCATGIVSQFAQQAPWNGGYRLLVRYASDLVKVTR